MLPARDDIETRIKRLKKAGNLCRVVLQVGIHGEDDFTTRDIEAGIEGCSLPEIATKTNQAGHLMTGAQRAQMLGRGVARAIIDEDDLYIAVETSEDIEDLYMELVYARLLVESGDDH